MTSYLDALKSARSTPTRAPQPVSGGSRPSVLTSYKDALESAGRKTTQAIRPAPTPQQFDLAATSIRSALPKLPDNFPRLDQMSSRTRFAIAARRRDEQNTQDQIAKTGSDLAASSTSRSLRGQAAGLLTSSPQGILELAKGLGNAPWSLSRAGADLISGENNIDLSGNLWQDVQATFREYTPLLADISSSVRRTANVTGIGAEKNIIGRYQEAVAEGRILEEIATDAGNVALASGIGAKALGTTSTTRAGTTGLRAAERSPRPILKPKPLPESRPTTLSRAAESTLRPQSVDVRNPSTLSFTTPGVAPLEVPFAGRPTGMSRTAVPGPAAGVERVFNPGKGIAGILERKATGGKYSTTKPRSAQLVATAGEKLRRYGLAADWLDPSTPLLTGAAQGISSVSRGAARIIGRSDAVARWKKLIENPPRKDAAGNRPGASWMQSKIIDANERLLDTRNVSARAEDIQMKRTDIQKAAISAQKNIADNLNRTRGREVGDLWGSVVLASVDAAFDDLARQVTNNPGRADDLVKERNRNVPEQARVTVETIDAYNEYSSGRLAQNDPRLAAVVDESVTRLRRQSVDRTTAQLEAGNIIEEQFAEPTRASDDVPMRELSDADRRAAIDANDVNYGFLPSFMERTIEQINDSIAEVDAQLPAAEALSRSTEAELGISEAVLGQRPAPGTNVPANETIIARRAAADGLIRDLEDAKTRLSEIGDTYDSTLGEQKAILNDEIATLSAVVDDLVMQLEEVTQQVDLTYAELEARTTQAPEPIDMSKAEPRDVIAATGVALRDEIASAALGTFEQRWGSKGDGPRLGVADVVGGEWDAFSSRSPIWSNRRARSWYALSGFFPKAGNPDLWAARVGARTPELAGLDPYELSAMYLDEIDRLQDLNRKPHMNDEVVAAVAAKFELPEEVAAAAMQSKRAYKQAIGGFFDETVAYISANWNTLDEARQLQVLRDLDELDKLDAVDAATKDNAFYDLVEEAFDELAAQGEVVPTMRDLFGEVLTVLDVPELRKLLDNGKLAATKVDEAHAELFMVDDARRAAQDLLDDSRSRLEEVGRDTRSALSIKEALSDQQAAVDGAVADIRYGNETQDGIWDGGTTDQPTLPREVVVDGGPPEPNTFPADSVSDQMVRENERLRGAYSDARRDKFILEKRREQYQDKADNLAEHLNRSTQDELFAISRGGVAGMRDAVNEIAGARELGGYELSPTGGPTKLTGLVAKLANKLDLYREVVAEVDARLDDKRALHQILVADKNVDVPTSFDAWLKQELADAPTGESSIAGSVLVELSEGRIGDDLGDLNHAIVANDLSTRINQFFGDDLLGMEAAYLDLEQRVGAMDPQYRTVYSDDIKTKVDDAMGKAQTRFNNRLDQLGGQAMAAAPARIRTPMMEARRNIRGAMTLAKKEWADGNYDTARSLSALVIDSPSTLKMYAEQGLRTPEHLIGGGTGTGRFEVDASGYASVPEAKATRKRTTGLRSNNLRDYVGIESAEMTRIMVKQGVLQIALDPRYSTNLHDVLDDWFADWQRTNVGDLRWPEIYAALKDRGYEPIWGATADSMTTPAAINFDQGPTPNMVDPTGVARSRNVLGDEGVVVDVDNFILKQGDQIPDIRLMTEKMASALDEFQNPTANSFLRSYDGLTQIWKTAQLAWSPAWVTYNLMGNILMAGFGAGMGPGQIIKRVSQIREELRARDISSGGTGKAPLRTAFAKGTLEEIAPARLGAHGLSWSERQATMDAADADTRIGRTVNYISDAERSKVGSVTEFMYGLNEFTDNIFRTAVYLEELDRKSPTIPDHLLDDRGYVRQDLSDANLAEYVDINKAVEVAQDQSVRAALNVMGDFTRLTKAERTVVKRVFPFYPWLRHQTAMVLRIPVTNPLRWAWMQSLDEMLGDEDNEGFLNELLGMTVETPLGLTPLQAAVPFASGLSAFGDEETGSSLFDPATMGSAVNPLAKLALNTVTGIDLGRGRADTRPNDQKSTGVFGGTLPNSSLSRILSGDVTGGVGEVGYRALGLAPQTRGIRDMALSAPALGGDERPRYSSGDVIPFADPQNISLPRRAAGAARIPFLPMTNDRMLEVAIEKDLDAAEKRRRERARAAWLAGN